MACSGHKRLSPARELSSNTQPVKRSSLVLKYRSRQGIEYRLKAVQGSECKKCLGTDYLSQIKTQCLDHPEICLPCFFENSSLYDKKCKTCPDSTLKNENTMREEFDNDYLSASASSLECVQCVSEIPITSNQTIKDVIGSHEKDTVHQNLCCSNKGCPEKLGSTVMLEHRGKCEYEDAELCSYHDCTSYTSVKGWKLHDETCVSFPTKVNGTETVLGARDAIRLLMYLAEKKGKTTTANEAELFMKCYEFCKDESLVLITALLDKADKSNEDIDLAIKNLYLDLKKIDCTAIADISAVAVRMAIMGKIMVYGSKISKRLNELSELTAFKESDLPELKQKLYSGQFSSSSATGCDAEACQSNPQVDNEAPRSPQMQISFRQLMPPTLFEQMLGGQNSPGAFSWMRGLDSGRLIFLRRRGDSGSGSGHPGNRAPADDEPETGH